MRYQVGEDLSKWFVVKQKSSDRWAVIHPVNPVSGFKHVVVDSFDSARAYLRSQGV